MSIYENQAAKIRPPRSGEMQQIAVTSTAGATALDSDLPGGFVTVQCRDGRARVLFGASTVTVDFTATSGATLGLELRDGDVRHFYLESTDTHIAHDSDATATLQIVKSSD